MLPSFTIDLAEFYDQKAQKKENLELAESSLAEDDKFSAIPRSGASTWTPSSSSTPRPSSRKQRV